MQTRSPHPRTLILPALFALTCVVVTIVAYIVFGGSVPLAPEGYRVMIPIADASNLVPGSGVQIAGVKVGRVVAVRRAGNTAAATVELQRSVAPLHAGATAIDRSKTLLGEGYIELAPGPRTAPALPDGGGLPAAQVRPTVALDRFISTFSPATRTQLHRLFSGLAGAFGAAAPALNDALGVAAPFTADLGAVLGTLQAQDGNLGQLISGSAQVLDAVGSREGVLRAAVTSGERVLATTAARNRALTATVSALPAFLAALHTTADRVTAASPSLGRAVAALTPLTPQLAPALMTIDTAAPSFRGLFRGLPSVLAAGRRGLPALERIIPAARRAFAQFYPTARELIPFMQLFSVNRSVIDILANVGSVTSGSYVGAGGRVIGTASGAPTIWNETISGWAKKLPTNRQEPYPKPGALLDEGTIGVLKSYDCRNTGNPLLLPAFGSAPPCIVQGPWRFNDKSAYYPRLTLAKP